MTINVVTFKRGLFVGDEKVKKKTKTLPSLVLLWSHKLKDPIFCNFTTRECAGFLSLLQFV